MPIPDLSPGAWELLELIAAHSVRSPTPARLMLRQSSAEDPPAALAELVSARLVAYRPGCQAYLLATIEGRALLREADADR